MITKSGLVEMKAYKSPPSSVVLVAEAICILFSTQPSYSNVLKLMSSSNFMQQLISYPRNAISDYALESLVKYISNQDFTYDYIAKISSASANLCEWVRNVYEYGRLSSSVNIIIYSLSKSIICRKILIFIMFLR